ncbi:hypothetical protein CAOG_04080 [Capsaspora owczarzaki ATCC 30864]|nr:hypothetical protein CAOG_04080 [Capsaspora owczarzaki ATCC 30864]|eukprot:XP_004347905.1 hypothetical protein CAOG_04080 [Capsaspora owczarzaki ATCC 30864]
MQRAALYTTSSTAAEARTTSHGSRSSTAAAAAASAPSAAGAASHAGIQLPRGFALSKATVANTDAATTHDAKSPLRPAPVAVVFGWMGAKTRHVHKTIEFYNAKGMDAISYMPTPRDVLQPDYGRAQLTKLLEHLNVTKNPAVFHCFSTGGYLYGQVLSLLQSPHTKHFHGVRDQVRGTVMDSVVDESGVRYGIPNALFPKAPMQRAIASLTVNFILNNFKTVDSALKHASESFHNTTIQAPSLWYYCRNDDIADHRIIEAVVAKWRARGLKCNEQFWEQSRHVSHAKVHPHIYFSALDAFIAESLALPNMAPDALARYCAAVSGSKDDAEKYLRTHSQDFQKELSHIKDSLIHESNKHSGHPHRHHHRVAPPAARAHA